jgi:predicted nucleic acid-binding Zn ribbon protein
MSVRRVIGPIVLLVLTAVPSQARAGDGMENEVLALINGERSTALIEHAGLLGAARSHSQEMAATGGLNHDGADERVANAAPDPPEANGPPDDGFAPAAWCEDVTYSTGFPESQVAQKIFQQWRDSPPHQACMTNAEKNVGAVGIYFDGSTWWATFIAEVDHTPPGGSAPRAAPTATPQREPLATNQGSPAATPPTGEQVALGTSVSSQPLIDVSGATTSHVSAAPAPPPPPVPADLPFVGVSVQRYEKVLEPIFSELGPSVRVSRRGVVVQKPFELAVIILAALVLLRRLTR